LYTFLIILHVIVAILLVVVILMQSSKGGGLAGAFGGAGGGGSQALFGGRGAASFLQKLTVGLAVAFMLLALFINLIGDQSATQQSVVQEAAQQQELTPGTPLPKPSGTEESPQGLAPLEAPGSQGTPIPQQNPDNSENN